LILVPSPSGSGTGQTGEINVNESAAHHPNRFLADLTTAMRATAETARQATLEQCKADAEAYVEQLHSKTEDEAKELRQAAENDVTTIRDRSKARVERIHIETEERITKRRELLEQELQDFTAAIELEIARVEDRVSAFEAEVQLFFEQLLQSASSDPTTFATMASQVPDPPAFAELDRQALANELRARREETARKDAAEETGPAGSNGSNGKKEELPDFWWMDSPATLARSAATSDCECLAGCPFFNDKMADMPGTAEQLKQHYCKGDSSRCARHMVFERLGKPAVPPDLYPDMVERAEQILAVAS
jgi:hypothetical protein